VKRIALRKISRSVRRWGASPSSDARLACSAHPKRPAADITLRVGTLEAPRGGILNTRRSRGYLRTTGYLGVRDHRANAERAWLFVIAAQNSAGARVDKMHLPAGVAAHGLVRLARFLGHIVRGPALHMETGVRASEEEWGHGST
jgi:hypothetical protein